MLSAAMAPQPPSQHPHTAHTAPLLQVKNIQPLATGADGAPAAPELLPSAAASAELKELTDSLADTQPAGALVGKCRTLDQAKAVVTFLDAASGGFVWVDRARGVRGGLGGGGGGGGGGGALL